MVRKPAPAGTAPATDDEAMADGRFIDLTIGYPPSSLEEMKLLFTRRLIFIARRWRNSINDGLREVGQSHARWITLTWIDVLDGKCNHRVLAERVGVELPTLIRLLNRLEEEGLVERRALDTRAKTVTLTREGRILLERLTRITREVRAEFLRDIDPDKLSVSMELLNDILVRTGDADSGV